MARLRVVLVLVVLLSTSCTSFSFGYQMGLHEGRTIDTATDEGAKLLRVVSEYDGSARDVDAEYGAPDYITVHEADVLYFFYVDEDTVVVLERGFTSPNSTATAHSPIPEEFMANLGLVPRRKIEAGRGVTSGAAE